MYTYRIESVKDGKLKFLAKVNISELADPVCKLKSTLRKMGTDLHAIIPMWLTMGACLKSIQVSRVP